MTCRSPLANSSQPSADALARRPQPDLPQPAAEVVERTAALRRAMPLSPRAGPVMPDAGAAGDVGDIPLELPVANRRICRIIIGDRDPAARNAGANARRRTAELRDLVHVPLRLSDRWQRCVRTRRAYRRARASRRRRCAQSGRRSPTGSCSSDRATNTKTCWPAGAASCSGRATRSCRCRRC